MTSTKNLNVVEQGFNLPPLSPEQQQILKLLTDEFKTIPQIAIIRRTSVQAVYKSINKIKAKGYLSGNQLGGFKKKQSTFQPPLSSQPRSKHFIRLHGQEFNIKILHKSRHYDNKVGSVIQLDENTIRLYQNSLEIYTSESRSFIGNNVDEATSLSFKYWNNFFVKLENKLEIIFMKEQYETIKVTNHHYTEVNNELAREVNINKDKIKIYAPEDGKCWFLIDNSFNLNEAETIHPKTAKEDMGNIVQPFFNNLRSNPQVMLYSEMDKLVRVLLGITTDMGTKINTFMDGQADLGVHLKSHIQAIQDLSKGVNEFTKAVKEQNLSKLDQIKLKLQNKESLDFTTLSEEERWDISKYLLENRLI